MKQFKRVRVVRRADGYYAQFCIDSERIEKRKPTGKTIGLDVGLNHLLTDSEGNTVENPRHLCNAARNILELGLHTVGHTGTNASVDIDLCVGEEIPPSKSGRRKRKPKERSLESPSF